MKVNSQKQLCVALRIKKRFMILEICVKGFVGRVLFFLTLKMGLKRKKG